MRGEPDVGQPFIERIGGSGREAPEDIAEVREGIDVAVPAGPVKEWKTAPVRPPRSLAGFRPFFRPPTTGRSPFCTGLSSVAMHGASAESTEASNGRLARVGRIDRSIGELHCARRCRRTEAPKRDGALGPTAPAVTQSCVPIQRQ
jgi:hypothetical protein